MIIDTHAHGFPESVLRGLAASGMSLAALPSAPWSDDDRIAEMDGVGVTREILSCPHLYMIEAGQLDAACRDTNDRFSASAEARPERFSVFAHLPLHDADAALRELERASALPGVCGALVPSNLHGHYLDEAPFAPIWAELARREFPVFMHPVDSPCYRDGEPPTVLAWPFDTTLAVVRLISRGLFDRHPTLRLILSHLGGTLPFIGHRTDMGFASRAPGWSCAKPPSSYLPLLYADLALGYSRPALECARALFGLEQLLFGSDHFNPKLPHLRNIVRFATESLAPDEREAILHANAERLFGFAPVSG